MAVDRKEKVNDKHDGLIDHNLNIKKRIAKGLAIRLRNNEKVIIDLALNPTTISGDRRGWRRLLLW